MKSKLQINLFYIVLIAVAVLTFFVFLPYYQALFLAATFAVVCYPIYARILKWFRGAKSISAFVSVLVIFILIVVPLAVVMFLFIQEIFTIYSYLNSAVGYATINASLGHMTEIGGRFLPASWIPHITIVDIQNYFGAFYGWAAANVTAIFGHALAFLADIFIFVLGLFFFLRDGAKFRELIIKLSPLKDSHDEKILHTMALSMNSVVSGSLLIALLQGIATAIGLFVFRMPSPIIWGTVSVIASLLPGLGTFLLMAGLVVYAFVSHGFIIALGFLAWSIIIIGSIDNLLRPVIYERGLKIHSFLILLSVFGGIEFFGALGFLIGPIILSLLFALMEFHNDVSSHPKHSSLESSAKSEASAAGH